MLCVLVILKGVSVSYGSQEPIIARVSLQPELAEHSTDDACLEVEVMATFSTQWSSLNSPTCPFGDLTLIMEIYCIRIMCQK